MFTTIIEYNDIFDRILNETTLKDDKNKVNTFIKLILEYPNLKPLELLNAAFAIDSYNHIILDGGFEFSIHPILNESLSVNLMEIVMPLISKYIPNEILGYLTEKHAKSIISKILEVEFRHTDSALDLRNRIDEMFSSGDMSIPVQGLRQQPNSIEVVMNGVFAPMLYKKIQFGDQFHKEPKSNKQTLKDVIKNYTLVDEDTPLMKLLPKFIITLKDLIPNNKDRKC